MEKQDVLEFEVDEALKQIFFNCCPSDVEQVKVSKLIHYIKPFMKTEIYHLEALQKSLDPNNDDALIDYSSFCKRAKRWIRDNFFCDNIQQDNARNLLNNEDAADDKTSLYFSQTLDTASTNINTVDNTLKLEEKLNSAVAQNELLSFELNEFKIALEVAEREKNELTSKNQKLHCNTNILQNLNEQNQKLIKQLEEVNELYQNTCKQNSVLKKSVSIANQKNMHLIRKLSECEIKNRNLEEKLAYFTEKYVKGKEPRMDLQDLIKEGDLKIVSLETACAHLKSECEELEEQLKHYRNENKELKNKIKQLEDVFKQELYVKNERSECGKSVASEENYGTSYFKFCKPDEPFNSPTLLKQLTDPISPIGQSTSCIISTSTPMSRESCNPLLSPIQEQDSESEEANDNSLLDARPTYSVNSSEEDLHVSQMLQNFLKYSPHASLRDEILQVTNEPLNLLQVWEEVTKVRETVIPLKEENAKLKHDCKTYCETINMLTTELDCIKSELNNDKVANENVGVENCNTEDVENTNEYLRNTIEKISIENEHLIEDNARLKKELLNSGSKTDALKNEYLCKEYQLNRQIDNVAKECSCYRDQICRLEHNNTKLTQELQSFKSEAEDLYNKYKILLEENHKLDNQMQTINKNMHDIKRLNDDYSVQTEKLNNDLLTQKNINKTLSIKLRQMKYFYNKLRVHFELCKKQLGISRCHNNKLKAHNTELRDRIKKYECKKQEICKENESLNKLCDELKVYRKTLETENEKLKNTNSKRENTNQIDKKGTFNKMHNKIDKLEDRVVNLRNAISAYKQEKCENEMFEREMMDNLKEQKRLLERSNLQTFNQWRLELQNLEEATDLEVSIFHPDDSTVWGPKKPLEEEVNSLKKQIKVTVDLLHSLCKIKAASIEETPVNADNNSLHNQSDFNNSTNNLITNNLNPDESFTDDHKLDATKEIQQKLNNALTILESFSSASVKRKCKEQLRRMKEMDKSFQLEILKFKEMLIKIQTNNPEVVEVIDTLLQLDTITQFSSRVSMCAMRHGLLNRNSRFTKCVKIIAECVLLMNSILKQTKQAKVFLVNERAILNLFNNFGQLQELYEQEENEESSRNSTSTKSSLLESGIHNYGLMKCSYLTASVVFTLICLFGVFVYYLFNKEERSLNMCPAFSASSEGATFYKRAY